MSTQRLSSSIILLYCELKEIKQKIKKNKNNTMNRDKDIKGYIEPLIRFTESKNG